MGDPRFDNRSKSTFKKDIAFGTQVEKYFFNAWVSICQNHPKWTIHSWENNGVCNDGSYIETGKATAGADYRITARYRGEDSIIDLKDYPIEVKWVPTAGKLTLKVGDLRAYIKECAAILFIYNSNPDNRDLRKPKDRNFDRHIKRIERAAKDIRWGVMSHIAVNNFLKENEDRIENIKYMGYKPGIILPSNEFHKHFDEERWVE